MSDWLCFNYLILHTEILIPIKLSPYLTLELSISRCIIDCMCIFVLHAYASHRHITSQPGFKYKYHGLPDSNSFWAGALLDKLRLWQPSETLLDKPYSLYNIFQPVQHPKISNPHSPIAEQKTSWPENKSGYVQFGSQNRKSYHV